MTDLKDMPEKVWVSDSIATNGLGIQVCSIKPNNTFPRPQTAYIRADLAERGWKPIKSAPRDGIWCLYWDARMETAIIAKRGMGDMPQADDWGYELRATHWQPLPQPPKGEAQS